MISAFSNLMGRVKAASPRQAIGVAVGALAVGAVAFASFKFALVSTTHVRNADMALKFAPTDPIALAIKADQRLAEVRRSSDAKGLLAMAREAALHDALNSRATRIAGTAQSIVGQAAQAKGLYELSEQLSRRELGTQLALIEERVKSNDEKGALRHYDIVLRTSPSGQATLFPILAAAIEDPGIGNSFSKLLQARPVWLKPFMAYVSTQKGGHAALANAIRSSGGLPEDESYWPYENGLVLRLVQEKQFGALESYVSSLKSGRTILTGLGFEPSSAIDRFQPLAWQLQTDSGAGAAIDSPVGSKTERLTAYAARDERGLVARKLVVLEPGEYVFATDQSVSVTGKEASVQWQILCAETSKPLWEGPMQSALGRATVESSLSIQQNCRALWVDLIAAGGSEENGIEITVRSAKFRRVVKS